GSACHVKGSYQVVQRFKDLVAERGLEEEVELMGTFCLDACSDGVAVKVNEKIYTVKPEGVDALFNRIMEGTN
ncbi:MAG: (2Fe-2S) ferredoxin domain-containing protein, partial [Eubacterium sp.]